MFVCLFSVGLIYSVVCSTGSLATDILSVAQSADHNNPAPQLMFTAVRPVEGSRTSRVSVQSNFQTEATNVFQSLLSRLCPAGHLYIRLTKGTAVTAAFTIPFQINA